MVLILFGSTGARCDRVSLFIKMSSLYTDSALIVYGSWLVLLLTYNIFCVPKASSSSLRKYRYDVTVMSSELLHLRGGETRIYSTMQIHGGASEAIREL